MSLYTRLVEAGCEIDNHCSDLYVKRSLESEKVIAQYEADKGKVTQIPFIDQIEHKAWIEFPFRYDPYWDAKEKR